MFTFTFSSAVSCVVVELSPALPVVLLLLMVLLPLVLLEAIVLLVFSTLGGAGFGFLSNLSNSRATMDNCLGTSSDRKTGSSEAATVPCAASFSSIQSSAFFSISSTFAISVSFTHGRLVGHSASFSRTVMIVLRAVATASGRAVLSINLSKIGSASLRNSLCLALKVATSAVLASASYNQSSSSVPLFITSSRCSAVLTEPSSSSCS